MLKKYLLLICAVIVIAALFISVTSCGGKGSKLVQGETGLETATETPSDDVRPADDDDLVLPEEVIPVPFAEETEPFEGMLASELPEVINRDVSAIRLNAPTNVVAWDGTYNDRCRVTWVHPAGEAPSIYYVYRSTTASNPSPTYIGGRSYPGRIFDDTTAIPGTHYYYKVKSHKVAFTDSYFSNEDQGWRNDRMNTPTNLTASDGTYNDKVYVYWTHPANETPSVYYVYRSETQDDPNPTYIGGRSYPGRTFYDATAIPGTKYWYKVKSHKDGFKDSVFSNEHRGWRKAKLNTIPQVKATDGYYMDKVKVRWEDTYGIQPDIYYVYRSESWSGNYTYIGGTSASNWFYFDHTALPDVTYYYRVKGHKDGYDDSPWSNQDAGWLGEWSSQVVDNSSAVVGYGTSMVFNWLLGEFISYVDVTNGYLKYTYHDTDTWEWTNETIDNSGNVGAFQTSLKLDDNNYPHISYLDTTNHYVKYATFDGSDWTTETVDGSGDANGGTSLVLDPEFGYPSVAYVSFNDKYLMLASFNGSDWNTEIVDDNVSVYQDYVSIGWYYNEGTPCISYIDTTNGHLRFTYHDGTEWLYDIVDNSGLVADEACPLVIGNVGYPKIAYKSDDDLMYADWDGTSWNIQTVGTNRNPSSISLALGSDWNPHISYRSANSGILKYTRFNGTSWETMTADDTSASTGWFCSLAIDSWGTEDYPLISHYDATNGCLKLVTLD